MKKIIFYLIVFTVLMSISVSSYSLGLNTGMTVYGNSWGITGYLEFGPNVFNVWTDSPSGFEKVTSLPTGWDYQILSGGSWLQMYNYAAYPTAMPSSNFTIWWNDPETNAYMDWQEVRYNWSTGMVDASWQGGLYHPKNGGWSVVAYGNAGPSGPCPGYIPEPNTMLLLATGMLGFGVIARFRRRRKD